MALTCVVCMSLICTSTSLQCFPQLSAAHAGTPSAWLHKSPRLSLGQAKHCSHRISGSFEEERQRSAATSVSGKPLDLRSCSCAHQAQFVAREHACRVSRLRRARAARRATTGALGRADVQAQPDGSSGVQSTIAGAVPSLRACRPATSIKGSMLYDGQTGQGPCRLTRLNMHN